MRSINREQIKDGADKDYHREDNHERANHLIDDDNARVVKLLAYQIDEPRQSEPPQHGAADNRQITQAVLQRMIRNDKGELSKGSHEEKDNKRIRERDEKRRNSVVRIRTLLLSAYMHVLNRIGSKANDAEDEQHDASHDFENEEPRRLRNEIHHETHTQTRKERINQIACCSAYAGNEAIPATLVQGTLHTKHPNGAHWCRGNNADKHPLDNNVKKVYVKQYRHKRPQRYKKTSKSPTKSLLFAIPRRFLVPRGSEAA